MASNNNIIRHITEIHETPNGWFYQCKTCGYRAVYNSSLTVEFIGNGNENSSDLDNNKNPHSDAQIEEILQKYARVYQEW